MSRSRSGSQPSYPPGSADDISKPDPRSTHPASGCWRMRLPKAVGGRLWETGTFPPAPPPPAPLCQGKATTGCKNWGATALSPLTRNPVDGPRRRTEGDNAGLPDGVSTDSRPEQKWTRLRNSPRRSGSMRLPHRTGSGLTRSTRKEVSGSGCCGSRKSVRPKGESPDRPFRQ